MSLCTKEEINKILEKKYIEYSAMSEYSNRILGVAAIGPCLYNLDITADIQTVSFYIPSEDDLYILNQNEKINQGDNNNILIDIRYLYTMIKEQDLSILQSLVSPYWYFNPKYETFIQTNLFNNIDILLNWNIEDKINILINKSKNTNDLLLSYIYKFICENYLSYNNMRDNILLNNNLYLYFLQQIQNKTMQISVPAHEFEQLRERAKNIQSNDNSNCIKLLTNFISNIMQLALNKESKETNFISNLTQLEHKVLNLLLKENNEYFNISILTKEYGISRPVFTTLLNKLKNNKIAEIDNKGAKGTYIHFNNKEYLKTLFEK